MGKHNGKFKWKKYSKYNGNLRHYWEAPWRFWDRHNKYTPEPSGFREEWGLLTDDYSGSLFDSKEELMQCNYRHHEEKVYVRYVTEWEIVE